MATNNLASELRAIASRLEALASLVSDQQQDSPETAEKIARRECLICGRIFPLEEKFTRGICSKEYQKIWRQIDAGAISEADLIAEGKMSAESKRGGRPADPAIENLVTEIRKSEHPAVKRDQPCPPPSETRELVLDPDSEVEGEQDVLQDEADRTPRHGRRGRRRS